MENSKKLRRISTKCDYQHYQQEEILIKLVTPVQSCKSNPIWKNNSFRKKDYWPKRKECRGTFWRLEHSSLFLL